MCLVKVHKYELYKILIYRTRYNLLLNILNIYVTIILVRISDNVT